MQLRSHGLRLVAALLTVAAIVACGGDESEDQGAGATADETVDTSSESTEAPELDTTEGEEQAEETDVGTDACSLLDEGFLNDTLEGQVTNFGDPFRFQAPLQSAPSAFCSWTDGATGLSLQLTVEPSATAETDSHSDRAYNLDEEPTVEPQDGPAEKAVLLIDTATADLGGEPFPYGYFFVDGDVTVFIETVGLDVGADALRTFADEADRRLNAGR